MDELSEARRCRGSVARGHGTELTEEGGEGGGVCISSNEIFTSPPTKGVSTGPLASVHVCILVYNYYC